MRRLSGEFDDGALHGADEGQRHGSGWRAGGDRPRPAPRADESGAALDQRFGDPPELTTHGVILTAELEPQRHRHAGDIAPAVHGMPARKGDQRQDRVRLLFDEPADLVPPRLIDPLDHGQGKILLVLELVIERPAGVTGLTRHLLEDVWALPTPGGPDDFPRLVQGIVSGDASQGSSRIARTLFAIRWKLGELLGWDGPDAGLGSRVPTLCDRLPADLRDAPAGPDIDRLPFTSLYLLDDEWAVEIANRTMHGVMHLGWVPDGSGRCRGQMAVLVKPNGLLGNGYMAAIKPFRHLIVYPGMIRQIGRNWQARAGEPTPARA